jgi:hypothetical protein
MMEVFLIRDIVGRTHPRYCSDCGESDQDYRGQSIRLTDERLEHILSQHPEMAVLGPLAIVRALRHPDTVIVPATAPGDRLYYRRQSSPELGDKYLCVVVKLAESFVVTAYVTARLKNGARVWPETT